ncbi:MAG: enoyl-CoA hydratase/isomerase family protein [Gemmatimonadetes bacterium]|nr:enoyl-CoA hydratase/isomerase family protein [Gemmatimonadota bacterium]
MSGGVVEYAVDGGVATVLMNRPGKRNALSAELVWEMSAAFDRARDDRAARVVVLRGAGPDFCAGADLDELARVAEQGAEANLADADVMGRLFLRIRRLPQPVIAAVHGRALGGGCGLATACDLVLAAADAELGYPEVRIGFVPALVMTFLRRKLPEGRAFELMARGDRIGAAEAERVGLVNRVYPAESFHDDVAAYAVDLASRPRTALALTKRLLYGLEGVGLEEGIARGSEVNALARQTREFREGVRAFLERRR